MVFFSQSGSCGPVGGAGAEGRLGGGVPLGSVGVAFPDPIRRTGSLGVFSGKKGCAEPESGAVAGNADAGDRGSGGGGGGSSLVGVCPSPGALLEGSLGAMPPYCARTAAPGS